MAYQAVPRCGFYGQDPLSDRGSTSDPKRKMAAREGTRRSCYERAEGRGNENKSQNKNVDCSAYILPFETMGVSTILSSTEGYNNPSGTSVTTSRRLTRPVCLQASPGRILFVVRPHCVPVRRRSSSREPLDQVANNTLV